MTLRQRGVIIAIDDFGKGYSSLAYLKNLPSNTLQIDGPFVENLSTSRPDFASKSGIALAMISLGHPLHLRVIAEGVET